MLQGCGGRARKNPVHRAKNGLDRALGTNDTAVLGAAKIRNSIFSFFV